MELLLKVILVSYVVYAVLGAPLLASSRTSSGRRMVR